jgi:hypothetical protein
MIFFDKKEVILSYPKYRKWITRTDFNGKKYILSLERRDGRFSVGGKFGGIKNR